MIAYIILGLVALILAVILIKASLHKPLPGDCPYPFSGYSIDRNKAANRLAELVRCRTVSPKAAEDESGSFVEFEKFRSLLTELYPKTHQALNCETAAGHSLLYRWAGKKSEKPLLLMAHYDVVPAREEQWRYPPFDGVIDEGIIWGRGTLDTKGTVCAIFEAVEILLAAGFEPEQDIYLAFGHDEETAGTGAPAIVELLESRGVRPEMVLDEGGAIVDDLFPGVSSPVAVVGMAEKGYADIGITLEGTGGHSYSPGENTLLSEMSKIILRLDKKPFRAHLPAEAREMFDILSRHMPFGYRLIFANLWFFGPLLIKVLPLISRELNALCRSTCVFTMAEGSTASNVLPERAHAVANLRLMALDPLEKAVQHFTDQALAASKSARMGKDPIKMKVKLLKGHNASPSSKTDSKAYRLLAQTISSAYPGTIVSPYIMFGVTDSRHYYAISDNVFRFAPIRMSREELRSIHGIDERIPVEKLARAIHFYLVLISIP
jgi:carboxypeptidase PM20D1